MTSSISHRGAPGPWAMLIGLAGTGLMWFLQTEFGETLTAQVCARHDMASPVPPWLMHSVHGVTALAVLAGAAGAGLAWRNWRQTRDTHTRDPRALDNQRERRHFLATAGLLFSLLFLVGLVAAVLAVLLVSPCSAWR
ncbi:MAG TPA: hypothetical protein VFM22_00625 [Castellaniella sp.]|nr:hypothetical protein [Castellaniella sp.]